MWWYNFKLSDNCCVRGKRVTAVGVEPLSPDLQLGRNTEKEGRSKKKRQRSPKPKQSDVNFPVFTFFPSMTESHFSLPD